MADMVFMLLFLHCRPRYLVWILRSLRTYSCIMACFTLSARFRMGADLNTTSICKKRDRHCIRKCSWWKISCSRKITPCLTIVLECFHLVILLRILSRLMQEKRLRQQNWLLSPASCWHTHILFYGYIMTFILYKLYIGSSKWPSYFIMHFTKN